jgi:hypothetical protein
MIFWWSGQIRLMQDQSGQAHDGTGDEGRSLTMPTASLHSLVYPT